MAVVRTFDPRVDLAGAYLGGQRIKLGREQLAQEAASDAARIALGREQLQQEAVNNEMQLAAKKDILSREALQKAQEAEITKAYNETQIGLSRRRVEDDERNTMMRLGKAAMDFEDQQNWETKFPLLVKEGEASGKTRQQSEADAARALMLQRGGTGAASALSTGREPSPRKYNAIAGIDPLGLNPPSRLQMTAPEFHSFLQTASPELRTNTVNTAIEQMLQPPAGFSATNAPAVSGGEVIRKTKDGRTAIFDAATKKFIRYAN